MRPQGLGPLGELRPTAAAQAVGHQPVDEHPDRSPPVADGIKGRILRVGGRDPDRQDPAPGVEACQHAVAGGPSATPAYSAISPLDVAGPIERLAAEVVGAKPAHPVVPEGVEPGPGCRRPGAAAGWPSRPAAAATSARSAAARAVMAVKDGSSTANGLSAAWRSVSHPAARSASTMPRYWRYSRVEGRSLGGHGGHVPAFEVDVVASGHATTGADPRRASCPCRTPRGARRRRPRAGPLRARSDPGQPGRAARATGRGAPGRGPVAVGIGGEEPGGGAGQAGAVGSARWSGGCVRSPTLRARESRCRPGSRRRCGAPGQTATGPTAAGSARPTPWSHCPAAAHPRAMGPESQHHW